MVLYTGKRHPNHGCPPIKQDKTSTVAQLASLLYREDLHSIVRPEHVVFPVQECPQNARVVFKGSLAHEANCRIDDQKMGILKKTGEGGHAP